MGFDFDTTKTEQIFDLLLKEKQLVLSADHNIPSAEELRGRKYCKWHNSVSHHTAECKVLRQQIQSAIEQGRLIFGKGAMKVDRNPFPVNMVINMVDVTSNSKNGSVADRRDRLLQFNPDHHISEDQIVEHRQFRPKSRELVGMYAGRSAREQRRR